MNEGTPTPFDDGALYDRLCDSLDYGIEFYVSQAKAARGPVLEVACGTGRILLPMLRAGVDADGLDAAPAMLEQARVKASAEGFHPALHQSLMREFHLPRRYALVAITFNSYVHNLTQEDQIATLRTCREHLLPGGKLVFDIFFPGAEMFAMAASGPVLEGEFTDPATGHRLQMYDDRTLDPVAQTQHSENEVRELDLDGNLVRMHRSATDLRWVYPSEMALLLRLAGFNRWEITGFNGEPLTGTLEPMVVAAWCD
jgi:SAM-dependent methyltransferase